MQTGSLPSSLSGNVPFIPQKSSSYEPATSTHTSSQLGTMLPLARSAASSALCGRFNIVSVGPPLTREAAARPRLALLPRAQPIAALSTSTVKAATALERQSTSGQPLTASGKVRNEVPLPSQEKKEGAMQYVLFVTPNRSPWISIDFVGERPLIRSQIGRAKAPFGQ